mmetsp:Transcript_93878/g.205506  ORF Transcript_93878/g.205506 Transcript_93878/m.205506 type:complete len:1069 (-) Transcript_93878:186-3392(-)
MLPAEDAEASEPRWMRNARARAKSTCTPGVAPKISVRQVRSRGSVGAAPSIGDPAVIAQRMQDSPPAWPLPVRNKSAEVGAAVEEESEEASPGVPGLVRNISSPLVSENGESDTEKDVATHSERVSVTDGAVAPVGTASPPSQGQSLNETTSTVFSMPARLETPKLAPAAAAAAASSQTTGFSQPPPPPGAARRRSSTGSVAASTPAPGGRRMSTPAQPASASGQIRRPSLLEEVSSSTAARTVVAAVFAAAAAKRQAEGSAGQVGPTSSKASLGITDLLNDESPSSTSDTEKAELPRRLPEPDKVFDIPEAVGSLEFNSNTNDSSNSQRRASASSNYSGFAEGARTVAIEEVELEEECEEEAKPAKPIRTVHKDGSRRGSWSQPVRKPPSSGVVGSSASLGGQGFNESAKRRASVPTKMTSSASLQGLTSKCGARSSGSVHQQRKASALAIAASLAAAAAAVSAEDVQANPEPETPEPLAVPGHPPRRSSTGSNGGHCEKQVDRRASLQPQQRTSQATLQRRRSSWQTSTQGKEVAVSSRLDEAEAAEDFVPPPLPPEVDFWVSPAEFWKQKEQEEQARREAEQEEEQRLRRRRSSSSQNKKSSMISPEPSGPPEPREAEERREQQQEQQEQPRESVSVEPDDDEPSQPLAMSGTIDSQIGSTISGSSRNGGMRGPHSTNGRGSRLQQFTPVGRNRLTKFQEQVAVACRGWDLTELLRVYCIALDVDNVGSNQATLHAGNQDVDKIRKRMRLVLRKRAASALEKEDLGMLSQLFDEIDKSRLLASVAKFKEMEEARSYLMLHRTLKILERFGAKSKSGKDIDVTEVLEVVATAESHLKVLKDSKTLAAALEPAAASLRAARAVLGLPEEDKPKKKKSPVTPKPRGAPQPKAKGTAKGKAKSKAQATAAPAAAAALEPVQAPARAPASEQAAMAGAASTKRKSRKSIRKPQPPSSSSSSESGFTDSSSSEYYETGSEYETDSEEDQAPQTKEKKSVAFAEPGGESSASDVDPRKAEWDRLEDDLEELSVMGNAKALRASIAEADAAGLKGQVLDAAKARLQRLDSEEQ